MLTFFIGSYTKYLTPEFGGIGHGIYTVQLNTETGVLNILHTQYTVNPSYLAISNDNSYLYCSAEVELNDNPLVKAYRIKDDFSLEFLNAQPVLGGFPCHIVKINTNILIACYATGNLLQYPLDEDKKLKEYQKNYYHKGSSSNKARQEAPHAHQVAIHPNNKDVYVCDLGIDTIKAYHFLGDELIPNEEKDISITKGGGPRHMVFNKEGNMAYVINELTGAVSVLRNKKGRFKEVNNYSALPNDYDGQPSGSAIRMHPNGTFLYAANRQLEAIAIFKVKGEELELLDYKYTQGNEVREFNISPDGEWLIACHQNSHDTVVYQIQKDGELIEKYRTKEILSPVCVVFPKNNSIDNSL